MAGVEFQDVDLDLQSSARVKNALDPASAQDYVTRYFLDARISSGVLAARPAAGTVGRFYFATDVGPAPGTGYFDNGTVWVATWWPTEVYYTELGSAFTTTSASLVDVPGLSTPTLTFGDRPFEIRVKPVLQNNTSADNITLQLLESVNGGAFAEIDTSLFQATAQTAYYGSPPMERRRAYARGTNVVYKVQASVNAGTGTVQGAATFTSLLSVWQV